MAGIKSSWLMLRRSSDPTSLVLMLLLISAANVCSLAPCFVQAGRWNSPAAASVISDLMMLPRCEHDGITTHLITYDVADLDCQLPFIKNKQENFGSHAPKLFVIFLKTDQKHQSGVFTEYRPQDSCPCLSLKATQIVQWIVEGKRMFQVIEECNGVRSVLWKQGTKPKKDCF